jgi:hypothetical protein
MSKPTKIVSGGQTGVDQAALRAAKACGLPVGGWCPPGRLCESGIIPPEFALQGTPGDRSAEAPQVPRSQRSEWNVRDSDATLVLRPSEQSDLGTEWAVRCAVRYGRPLLDVDPADPAAVKKITKWIRRLPVQILNVAGPSESEVPGIGDQVYSLLIEVFRHDR